MIKLRYGNTNTFYVPGAKGGLLIDTDWAGTLPQFFKAIKSAGLGISDISCVLATHYHPDHVGIIEYEKSSHPRQDDCFSGAATQIRTGDLILTKDALYLLSYSSKVYAPYERGISVATEKGLEPSTSGVTGRRSNRLNYPATARL